MTLGLDQSVAAWQSSFGVQSQWYGAQTSHVPNELDAETAARQIIDVYGLRQIAPGQSLRVSVQNLLAAAARRTDAACAGAQYWQLDTRTRGPVGFTVSLEGKW